MSHDNLFFHDSNCRYHPRRNLLVISPNSDSSLPGILGLIIAVLAVSVVIQFVAGSLLHWLPILLAIAVGLMAVKAING